MRNESSPAISIRDRKSTRLDSSHLVISYAVFCFKKATKAQTTHHLSRDAARAPRTACAPQDAMPHATGGAGLDPNRGRRSRVDRYSFFFNDTATTEIYPLSLHDALPI